MVNYTDEQLTAVFKKIIKKFLLKGELVTYFSLQSGNINDTYVIRTDYEGRALHYLVQRVNTNAFKEPEKVADNVCKVTEFIRNKMIKEGVRDYKRKVIRYYSQPNGAFYYIDNGSFWRVVSYVYDSVSYDKADENILYYTGVAFGEFQKYISDFPIERLYETIKDFHNTVKRYEDLKLAAEKDEFGRLASVRDEYDYLMSMQKQAFLICELHKEGKIPLRVTHNDTKCNNVMFDSLTGKNLAVVDLDTVMPGFIAYDFGDAVRFAANPAGEDCTDISQVYLDIDKYFSFASGFIPCLRKSISKTEIETLPDGVLAITLELAARFLTDYLSGDVYFKCKMPEHNLVRTRTQIALAKDISAKMPFLRSKIVHIDKLTKL